MAVSLFLKTRLVELVFNACAAAALCYSICSGFFSTQPLQSQLWVIVTSCSLLVALLYLVSISPRTLLAGGVCLGVVVVVVFIVFAYVNPGASPVDDVEGNMCIFALIVVACCLVSFLLSRTRPGSVILLVGGMAICAAIEFLYWYGHVIALCVFSAAATGLLIVRNYQVSLIDSDSEKLSFGSAGAVGLGMGVLSVGLACAVFMLVIAPLEPPSLAVKLFTEYRRAEVVDIAGLESTHHVQGDERSDNTTDGDDDTSDSDEDRQTQEMTIASLLGVDTNQLGDAGATTGLLTVNLMYLLIPLAVVLAVVCSIVVKRAMRRRRYARMVRDGDRLAVVNLYLFFIDRLSRMGRRKITCPIGSSLAEFSLGNRLLFQAFERKQSVDADSTGFDVLTDVYARVVYGGDRPSADDRKAFDEYYARFYGNVMHYMGRIRYAFKFFAL